MFRSFLIAGFEVARVAGGTHCMIDAVGHEPGRNMRRHFQIAQEHGMRAARDGLPWWLPLEPRLELARDAGMQVIWDLDHWWRNPDPIGYAHRVVEAVNKVCPTETFRFCFNELSVEGLSGRSFWESVHDAKAILRIVRAGIYDARLVTAEPAHRRHELMAQEPWAEEAEVIGLNLYPHNLGWDVGEALYATWEAYRKPVAITETSFNPICERRWRGIGTKAGWLLHVLNEIERARSVGVEVVGCCWYPLVDSPWWGAPEKGWWDHGLIRSDLSLDADFSATMKGLTHMQQGVLAR